MANRKVIPYHLLTLMLYGRQSWIERDGMFTVLPVRDVCKQLRVRPAQIQEALFWLEEEQILTCKWSSTYFTVRLSKPVGMGDEGIQADKFSAIS